VLPAPNPILCIHFFLLVVIHGLREGTTATSTLLHVAIVSPHDLTYAFKVGINRKNSVAHNLLVPVGVSKHMFSALYTLSH
jgi:hypothetical protein